MTLPPSPGNIDSLAADTLAQILSINLIRSGKYLVYPRTATLEQVQAEYNTQLSGLTADEHLVDMDKGDNPRFVLSVAARRLGSLTMFNASIINLESGVQETGRSVNYATLDDGIRVMESLARELAGAGDSPPAGADAVREAASSGGGAKKDAPKAGGAAFGYGVLNLGLGLGSLVQGDLAGGFTLLGGYGAAAGLTVSFNAAGGSPATQTRTVNGGDSIGASNMPDTPTRSGYTFGGWYTGRNGGGAVVRA